MADRSLTADEIGVLESRGCQAEDWSRVTVAREFTPGDSFRQVRFSGSVKLGVYGRAFRHEGGFTMPSGISHSVLHEVSVGNDCRIHRAQIARADIGDNVILEEIGELSRLGDSPFANALPVHVLTEDGARSLLLWRRLSSQLAHFLCHFKNHPAALAVEETVRRDAERLRLERSVVSSGCQIRRTGILRNVWLGEGVLATGAAVLENCYVESSSNVPVRIGEGVSAQDCVFLSGAQVNDWARLRYCLVGEGAQLGDGFTSRHSLFFANANFARGEAESVMAGPYSTSTHKATLVLTCQCLFITFGSGANASNHHFKLGPRHGGVLRRGVRCGSGSYLFWPSDIGAFTTVVGRHADRLDTANFPFSLLIGGKGDLSILVPGVNLFTAGLFRDAMKWRERDRRGNLERPRDLVNPAILSPYVIQDMEAGMELLRRAAAMGADLRHGGAVIPAGRFDPALKLYETALLFWLGEVLLTHAREAVRGGLPALGDIAELIRKISAASPDPTTRKWRDWGGMLLPGAEAEAFLVDAEAGKLAELDILENRLTGIHKEYGRFELAWAVWRWLRGYGEPSPEKLFMFMDKWRRAVDFRHQCFLKDAAKEFSPEAMLGFGLEEDRRQAFRRVRGTLAEHPLAVQAEAERSRLLALAERAR
ncbi:MAG: DUF4954 family protein [Planctomycetes bacterium]|nr:DUF4954 family protein [Planctomycetota bacterium]